MTIKPGDDQVEQSYRMGSILVGRGEEAIHVDVVQADDVDDGANRPQRRQSCIRVAGIRLDHTQVADLRQLLTNALEGAPSGGVVVL